MSKVVTFTSKVSVHYKGLLNDGTVFDSSEGRSPLEFEVGKNQVIAGFEKAVIDMEMDQTKTITIPYDEAYGEINEGLIHEINKTQLPDSLDIEIGKELVSTHPDGRQIVVRITNIDGDVITVDANHPLAGKDLTFELKVVDIS